MSNVKKDPPEFILDTDDGNDCAGHAAGMPLRRDLKLLPIEDVTLDLFRCVGLMFSTGDGNYWNCALEHAEKQLGVLDGPLFVARLTTLLRAIRTERHGAFSFLSAGCLHICDDEFAVMTMIKAARQGNFETLHEVAHHFARSSTVRRIDYAIRAIASEQSRHVKEPRHPSDEAAADRQQAVPTLH
ncbi:MAG TPA: hypothetical protein PLD46_01135 [Hyphomicrobium sp.]|nr:hypothetical protein [Hyphomicrobium sp.]